MSDVRVPRHSDLHDAGTNRFYMLMSRSITPYSALSKRLPLEERMMSVKLTPLPVDDMMIDSRDQGSPE